MKKDRIEANSNCHDVITSDDYADIYVRGINLEEMIEKEGPGCIQQGFGDWTLFHIKVAPEECDSFYLKQDYALIPIVYGLSSISSMGAAGILPVLKSKALNLSGNGVIIGVVDTGIDYTHEAFIYEDNTSKILNIWDQTLAGTPPEGFLYGSEFTQNQINDAINSEDPSVIVPSQDENGHGTFIAGLAAGRPNRKENFQGAAPDADLIVVKLKQAKKCLKNFFGYNQDAVAFQSNDILQGVKYIYNKSKEYGKPVVIVITAISSDGPHNGATELEKYLANLGDSIGVVIITSAGNEANRARHYFGRFIGKEKTKSVEFNIAENERGVFINMWSPLPDKLAVELISPSGNTTGKIEYLTREWIERELPLETSLIRVYYDLTEQRAAEESVAIIIKEPLPGLWTLVVYGDIVVNGEFDIYLPVDDFVKKDTYFLKPNPNRTVAMPSTNTGTITVGAINEVINSIYLPSGRGFTRDNKVKPDIVAPGVNVIGPYPKNSYGSMSGTSVSSAITAGASALILEWGIVKENDPAINTISMKTYLVRGAKRREGIVYPNREWGFGELNLITVFEEVP